MKNFAKFSILNDEDGLAIGEESLTMLINLDNIVSVKPIRIVRNSEIIDGFWIRTVNNKKYRAVGIPKELKDQFGEDFTSSKIIEKIDEINEEFLDSPESLQ